MGVGGHQSDAAEAAGGQVAEEPQPAGPVLGHKWELSLRALFEHETVLHTAAEGLVVAFFAALAGWPRANRTFQTTCVGFALMSASGIFVHLSGGYIEAHFHFFVMLAFLALCSICA